MKIERFITPERLIANRFDSERDIPEWDVCVVCFRDFKGSEALVQSLSGRPVSGKIFWGMLEMTTPPYIYTAEVYGKQIGIVTHCIWGGPQAAILIEELSAMHVPVVIGYGAAGSLDPSLTFGTQLVINLALSTDGTSKHYGTGPFRPDEKLLGSISYDVNQVTAATVDAVYRETPILLDEWKNIGAKIVNMEAAPFYAAASACGIQAIWLGHISDLLIGDWKDWYIDRDDMNNGTIEKCLEVIRAL